jgi:hypothetical protein
MRSRSHRRLKWISSLWSAITPRARPALIGLAIRRRLGYLLLATTVIGSGIMAECLAAGNIAVALFANTGTTVAVASCPDRTDPNIIDA